MNKLLSYILLIVGLFCLSIIVLRMLDVFTFSSFFERSEHREAAIANFSRNHEQILAFSDYLISVKPLDKELLLSIKNGKVHIMIGYLGWVEKKSFPKKYYEFRLSQIDSQTECMQLLHWNLETFRTVINRFKESHCESARTFKKRVDLGYNSGPWVSFGYKVFQEPTSATLQLELKKENVLKLHPRACLVQSIVK